MFERLTTSTVINVRTSTVQASSTRCISLGAFSTGPVQGRCHHSVKAEHSILASSRQHLRPAIGKLGRVPYCSNSSYATEQNHVTSRWSLVEKV